MAGYRFHESDMILSSRASEFFGAGVLASSLPYRFRTFNKALLAVPDLDQKSQGWLDHFNIVTTPHTATDLLHEVIGIPRITLGSKAKEPAEVDQVTLAVAYRANKDKVLEKLAEDDDPATHIVTALGRWATQHGQISDVELQSAERCFEQFLFGVHGKFLANQVQIIAINAQYELDISGKNEVA